MTKRRNKLWSVTRIKHTMFPHFTLRVSETTPGGTLYVFRWVNGRQRQRSLQCTRADLGPKHQQEKAARARACEIIEELARKDTGDSEAAERADSPGPSTPLTLGRLAEAYELNGFHGRTAEYKRDATAAIRRLRDYFGSQKGVASLRPSDVQSYYAHRTAQGVRAANRGDLVALKIAINWAVGEGLLDDNPLALVKLPKKQKPRRPWASVKRYEVLRRVARQVSPAFPVLLDLAWGTGRRLSALLALRWRDVDFATSKAAPHGSVTWYAGRATNNKVQEQTVPLSSLARAALEAWRDARPGIGEAFVFTGNKDRSRPLGRWIAKRWLAEAEKLAELEHMPHGGWHQFRRGWATARKDLPLRDVAEYGGWRDVATLLESYQHSDPDTMRNVADHGG